MLLCNVHVIINGCFVYRHIVQDRVYRIFYICVLNMCGAIAEYFKHLFCARAIAITMRVHSTNAFGEQNYFYACTLVV